MNLVTAQLPRSIINFYAHFLQPPVSYGNHGCQGGNMYDTYMYILANEGVATGDLYPFYGRVRLDIL